jgi:hypothetical protein
MTSDSTKMARVLAAGVIALAAGVGIALMARGAVQGIALVLIAGLLGAAYARLVLRWRPDSDEPGPTGQPAPEPDEVGKPS